LEQGKGTVGNWSGLEEISKYRDQEFKDVEALLNLPELNNWHSSDVTKLLIADAVTAKAYTYTDTILCLDTVTGKEIWRKEFPGNAETRMDWGVSSTPAVSGDKCYVAGNAGLYCVSVKDGAVVWQTKLKSRTHSSPLVWNGAVFILLNEGLTAYSAQNGQMLWSQPAVAGNCSSPAAWSNGGNDGLLVNTGRQSGNTTYCVERDTGKVLWRSGFSESYEEAYATPITVGDMMVICGHGVSGFRITPQKAEQIWRVGVQQWHRGTSPLVYRDHAYSVGYCTIGCYDLKTGAVKWEKANETVGESGSPIEADGKIIAVGVGGKGAEVWDRSNVIMFRATPEKYEELGRFESNFAHCPSPAIADGKLYLRMKDGLACYDLTEAGNR
jgi:outer membrane protein assembly factor BamB